MKCSEIAILKDSQILRNKDVVQLSDGNEFVREGEYEVMLTTTTEAADGSVTYRRLSHIHAEIMDIRTGNRKKEEEYFKSLCV